MFLNNRTRLHRNLLIILPMFFWLLSATRAQITIQGGSNQSGSNQTAQGGDSSPGSKDYPSELRVDFYMTPEEAKRLLGAVDEIIAVDSKLMGFAIHEHVQGQISIGMS